MLQFHICFFFLRFIADINPNKVILHVRDISPTSKLRNFYQKIEKPNIRKPERADGNEKRRGSLRSFSEDAVSIEMVCYHGLFSSVYIDTGFNFAYTCG